MSSLGLVENESFYDDIFIKKLVPSVLQGKKITWEVCYNIFEKYETSYKNHFGGLREYVVMREIFTRIDNSITFPSDSAYKNFKRKVKPSRKDDKNVVDNFYINPRSIIIGECCESFGLSPLLFDKICKQTYDDFLLSLRGCCTVTYEIALELFKFSGKMKYEMKDLLMVLQFLSGRDGCDKKLYSRIAYFHKKMQNYKSQSSVVKLEINEKLSTNIFEEDLAVDNQFRQIFYKYEKQIRSSQTKWEALSKNNEELKLLLSAERTSKLENSVRCSELELKLRDSERECQEACSNLRILVANSNASSSEEIKRLNNEIKTVKKQNSELTEKYDALSRKNVEMINEISTKNSENLRYAEKIAKEALKKRQLQKMKSYYLSKVNKLGENLSSFDLDSRISELRNEISVLENEKSTLQFELNKFMENEPMVLKNQDGSYKNKIRACYQDLVLSGVGINQTKNVILSVLKNIAGIEVAETELPGTTFARSQYEEARLLALAQLGTTLSKEYQSANNTLMSDGTSKSGNIMERMMLTVSPDKV